MKRLPLQKFIKVADALWVNIDQITMVWETGVGLHYELSNSIPGAETMTVKPEFAGSFKRRMLHNDYERHDA